MRHMGGVIKNLIEAAASTHRTFIGLDGLKIPAILCDAGLVPGGGTLGRNLAPASLGPKKRGIKKPWSIRPGLFASSLNSRPPKRPARKKRDERSRKAGPGHAQAGRQDL